MPRTLTLSAACIALLAATFICSAEAGAQGTSGDPLATDQQNASTTDPSSSDASTQANGGDATQDGTTDGTDDPAAVVSGGPAQITGSASGVTGYGVFRENVADAPVSQRNCWVQGMIQGAQINGELLAERVTFAQAQCVLMQITRHGLCANQRTNPLWSARPEQGSERQWSDNWDDASWGGRGRDDAGVANWNQAHAYPGRQQPRHHQGRDWGVSDQETGADQTTGDGSSAASDGVTTGATARSSAHWATMGCSDNQGDAGSHDGSRGHDRRNGDWQAGGSPSGG